MIRKYFCKRIYRLLSPYKHYVTGIKIVSKWNSNDAVHALTKLSECVISDGYHTGLGDQVQQILQPLTEKRNTRIQTCSEA